MGPHRGLANTTEEGNRFGRFDLLARIAEGGMGEVYLACQPGDGGFRRLTIIKRILPELTDEDEFVQMFLDEARIAGMIRHPNVCQIYELGQVDERYYMALEYLEGILFSELLRHAGTAHPLGDVRLLVSLVAQVAEGLHAAHEVRLEDGAPAGVVHRDVNPHNIMVSSAGLAKLLDFGVVKARNALSVTTTGAIKGTQAYMSPEQLRDEELDRRSDVFSLGTVLWEALAGSRLFRRDSDYQTWQAILEDPIPSIAEMRDDLPPALVTAVNRSIARDRRARFDTARDFAIAIEEALAPLGGPMTTVSIAGELEAALGVELERWRSQVRDAGQEPASPSEATEITAISPLRCGPGSKNRPLSGQDKTRPSTPRAMPPGPDPDRPMTRTEHIRRMPGSNRWLVIAAAFLLVLIAVAVTIAVQ